MFLLSHIRHSADGDVVVAHCAKVGAFAAVPVSAGHDRVFHRAVPECFAGEAVRVKIILRNGAAVLYTLAVFRCAAGKVDVPNRVLRQRFINIFTDERTQVAVGHGMIIEVGLGKRDGVDSPESGLQRSARRAGILNIAGNIVAAIDAGKHNVRLATEQMDAHAHTVHRYAAAFFRRKSAHR